MIFRHSLIGLFLIMGSAELLTSQNTHTLKVEFSNIEVGKGKIYVQLLNPSEVVLNSQILDAKANASVSFENLVTGNYWVRVYQDLNGNGELDLNYFGIPKEPYGFSNNVRPRFGPPDTEDMLISIPEAGKINIGLL